MLVLCKSASKHINDIKQLYGDEIVGISANIMTLTFKI